MVVFNTQSPIRREAIFESDTYRPTPARRTERGQFCARRRVKYAKAIACHRSAALDIQQRRVPGIADLAGEKTDAIRLRARREGWSEKADARVAQIRPVALSFQAVHPVAGLPTIADLATGKASGPLATAVSEVEASHIKQTHTIAALAPAAVGADVK